MRRAIRACVRAGLVHTHGGKHDRMTDPATGKSVPFSTTPSCQHGYKHLLRDVKRYLGHTVEL